MKRSGKIFSELKLNRLIALLNPSSIEECVTAYETCKSYGVILEIAFRSEYAVEGIKDVIKKYPDALLLAGTVMTRRQAENAISAGASGVVSADYIPEVVAACVNKDIMCIPGGLSDAGKQLAQKAKEYGCSLDELRKKYPYQWVYKLFPAFAGNISNVELSCSWKGPFKDLTVIYTGGINLSTLKQAVQIDPEGIFCASALVKHVKEPSRMKAEIEQWKEVLRQKEHKPAAVLIKKHSDYYHRDKVVTFGEMMIRLSPSKGIRFKQAKSFDVHFGGAEANVAVSLAQFGLNPVFVTAFPENDLGDKACSTLRMFGVDTQFIVRKGNRLGIYYLEHGSGPRPSKVIYDRSHSSASEIVPEDLDWERVLHGAKWFHWTGITPALSDSVADALREGLEVARRKRIPVSVDLNYRRKLWSREKACKVMESLMPFVDICIGNEEDPTDIFGLKPEGTDVSAGKLSIEGYREITKALAKRFEFKKVVLTLRESISASENFWSACLFDGKTFIQSPKYHVGIIDRVGSGDAFAAGLIYGIITGKSDSEALSFGVAAACIKHSIFGDFNIVSIKEVEHFLAGGITGRVQR